MLLVFNVFQEVDMAWYAYATKGLKKVDKGLKTDKIKIHYL